jgi:hypothetical protein
MSETSICVCQMIWINFVYTPYIQRLFWYIYFFSLVNKSLFFIYFFLSLSLYYFILTLAYPRSEITEKKRYQITSSVIQANQQNSFRHILANFQVMHMQNCIVHNFVIGVNANMIYHQVTSRYGGLVDLTYAKMSTYFRNSISYFSFWSFQSYSFSVFCYILFEDNLLICYVVTDSDSQIAML